MAAGLAKGVVARFQHPSVGCFETMRQSVANPAFLCPSLRMSCFLLRVGCPKTLPFLPHGGASCKARTACFWVKAEGRHFKYVTALCRFSGKGSVVDVTFFAVERALVTRLVSDLFWQRSPSRFMFVREFFVDVEERPKRRRVKRHSDGGGVLLGSVDCP